MQADHEQSGLIIFNSLDCEQACMSCRSCTRNKNIYHNMRIKSISDVMNIQNAAMMYIKRILFAVYDTSRNLFLQQVSVNLIKRISECTCLPSYIIYIWRCT